jgi:two-component system, chemotaxis family, chemotaxis protein CheY
MPDQVPAPRVLVIDDEAAVRAALCATLSDAGCAVTEARDGAEALEILSKAPADAVLMDIYMPLQDGFEAIRELRRVAPAVKIIAISGGSRGDFDPLKAAEMLGADRTLRKPFGTDDLLGALADLLPVPRPGGPSGQAGA